MTLPPKPFVLAPKLAGIPQELKALTQWVMWKYVIHHPAIQLRFGS